MSVSGRRSIAVLGAGEVGRLFSADLIRAGAAVTIYDPAYSSDELRQAIPGVQPAADESQAVAGVDFVFSVNNAAQAMVAMTNGLGPLSSELPGGPDLPGGSDLPGLWVDFNTAAPQLKRELHDYSGSHGVAFVDAAIMSPVEGKGLSSPVYLSGTKAHELATVMASLGGNATAVEGPVGSAAAKKLLRSIFFKGVAGVVLEALEAAEAASDLEWFSEHLAQQFHDFDRDIVTRLVSGTHRHAARREQEMIAAREFARDLGVEPRITRAIVEALHHLSATPPKGQPPAGSTT